MDLADILNNNNEDELRILDLVSNLDENDLLTGNRLYVASKYALARWVRRHSASYAANGVRINAVAPGNVNTSMTATMSVDEKTALNALPIPTKYGKETLMEPDEIASAINFLISKEARGVNGIIMFVDGGTDALLNSEKDPERLTGRTYRLLRRLPGHGYCQLTAADRRRTYPPTDRATEIIQSHNILYNERICTHDKRNRKQTEHPPL